MSTERIDGKVYSEMVRNGASILGSYRSVVNELNVFPVPDGDTGDNMYMTINSGAEMLKERPAELDRASDLAARGMLFGARGNSGVILSRIFYGIAKGFEGMESTDVYGFARALERGVTEAYGAVAEPVEGTILTVYREAVKYAADRLNGASTVESFTDDFASEMHRSLEHTPELLAVLKEAGVVDSGGAGLLYIVEGMRETLAGFIATAEAFTPDAGRKTPDLSAFTENDVLTSGYCTEFLLRLQKSKTGDPGNFDPSGFIEWVKRQGSSVVAFRDGSVLKIHVHTMRPGDILNEAQKYGEFLTLKIENMTLQENSSTVANRFEIPKLNFKKRYGTVAVASGAGVTETFRELGCDAVVEGGQSMNPSVEDLVRAIGSAAAETVFVFPNNGNVILTAGQAAALCPGTRVITVRTHSAGEGYAAMSVFDADEKDPDKILRDLEEAAASVVTGNVSAAVRDSELDGISVRKGQYLGFTRDRILTACDRRADTVLALAGELDAGNYGILMLIRGAGVPEEEGGDLARELQARFPDTEIIPIDGGQPVYDYMLVLE